MAPILPSSRLAQIEFFEVHLPLWAANPSAVGLSPAQIADLTAQLALAKQEYTAAHTARQHAQALTDSYHLASDGLADIGSDLIATIKSFAETANDPEVYTRAEITAPKSRGTLPPPGNATSFETRVLQTGEVLLTWKCHHPRGVRGVMYEIARCIGLPATNDRFTVIGTVGTRRFLDTTLAFSTVSNQESLSVTYRITPVRSNSSGPPAQHTIHFGSTCPALSSSLLPGALPRALPRARVA